MLSRRQGRASAPEATRPGVHEAERRCHRQARCATLCCPIRSTGNQSNQQQFLKCSPGRLRKASVHSKSIGNGPGEASMGTAGAGSSAAATACLSACRRAAAKTRGTVDSTPSARATPRASTRHALLQSQPCLQSRSQFTSISLALVASTVYYHERSGPQESSLTDVKNRGCRLSADRTIQSLFQHSADAQ